MKKKIFVLPVLLVSLFTIGCSNIPSTSAGPSGNGMKVPDFVSINSDARYVSFIDLVNEGKTSEMYYCNFCPAIISFKEEENVSVGDSFSKNILGTDVIFQTKLNGTIIVYDGNSSDNDIKIHMEYNTQTNELSYEQAVFGLNGGGPCLIISLFKTTIVNDVIHEKADLKMAFAGSEKMEINIGQCEIYIDNEKSGFCTLKLGYNSIDTNISVSPENITELKDLINNNTDVEMAPYYAAGKAENGQVYVYLGKDLPGYDPEKNNAGEDIANFKTKEEAQNFCSWTLFE